MGKALIVIGLVIISAGVILTFTDKIPLLGRLPGDIHIQKKNFSFYFPITTSILISVILTVIFTLISRR
jgi:hypothetical protein